MQHLKLERAHIVGSSLGAEVGLSIAANYPDRVLSLVCDGALYSEYGPYGVWEGSETDFQEYVASQLAKIANAPETVFPSVDALVEQRRKVLEKHGWWNEYVEAAVRYGAYEIDEGRYARGMGKQATVNYMKEYYQYRFEDYYRKVKCPVLMLADKELEDEREKAAMEGLCELAEQGEIVEISGWAHPYCWFLDPEDASKAILAFLYVVDEGETEEMAAFFDLRAAGYDAYIREVVFEDTLFTSFYQAMSSAIEETDEPLHILDLGCGTGLELEALFQRAPNARITGVDLSDNMLERLQARYVAHAGQITLVTGSFLAMPFGAQAYDHVLSAMAMHHLLPDAKRTLYKKIHAALKPGGKYIEGDSVTPTEMESHFLAVYQKLVAGMPQATDGHYHIDVPFSIDTQRSLLLEAGFRDFHLLWQRDSTAVWDIAVYVVTR
jgi:tRNA (cmo5U34)-methyltransferase